MPLASINNPMKVKQIYEKIDLLFPDSNFYFYDANRADESAEQTEIRRFITYAYYSRRHHIIKGNLEPIHHFLEER